ncbi:hypothetical protein D3C75_1025810 [compost metagenome]
MLFIPRDFDDQVVFHLHDNTAAHPTVRANTAHGFARIAVGHAATSPAPHRLYLQRRKNEKSAVLPYVFQRGCTAPLSCLLLFVMSVAIDVDGLCMAVAMLAPIAGKVRARPLSLVAALC